jgi:hypothetical protein
VLGNGMSVVDALTTVATATRRTPRINNASPDRRRGLHRQQLEPNAVNASIVDGDLLLQYGGVGGDATITVTATDLDGASSVQSAFTATAGFGVSLGGTTGNRSAQFTDADGTVTTVSLKGSGSAALGFAGSNLSQTGTGKVNVDGTITGLELISAAGTDTSTAITITSRGGRRRHHAGGPDDRRGRPVDRRQGHPPDRAR